MKQYSYKNAYGETYSLRLQKAEYSNNGNLAVESLYHDEDFDAWLPYAMVTVNLNEELPQGFAYVDANNFRDVVAFLEDNGIAKWTGRCRVSGFCQYPLVKFNEDAFKE